MIKLNLGDSRQAPEGWLYVDYAIGARLAKIPIISFFLSKLNVFKNDRPNNLFIHDLTKPFPWANSSVDIVYSSHTLEHLNKNDGMNFLNECYRILKPGGCLRIVIPDLKPIIDKYLNNEISAIDFIEKLDVLYYDGPNIFKKFFSFFYSYPHKTMYDYESLSQIFINLGLKPIKKSYGDSEIKNIKEVEIKDRCDSAVILESIKN